MGYLKSVCAVFLFPILASAMPVKSQMLKPRAYMQEADNNLLETLDLKAKTLRFTKADFEQCGLNMMRKAQTLTYSCSLPIPLKAKTTKLQNLVTARSIPVEYGSIRPHVTVDVSADAKTLTLTTTFDHTGIDFEVSKFNDDFFAVYAKSAQLVISEALRKQPVRIEVAESR